MDYLTVFGIMILAIVLIPLMLRAKRKPAGMKCSECKSRRITLISKEPLQLINGVNPEEGHAAIQVRYRFKYKCPDCNAERIVEAGESS